MDVYGLLHWLLPKYPQVSPRYRRPGHSSHRLKGESGKEEDLMESSRASVGSLALR